MSYNFNEDDKKVREFKETLPFGVSKVQLMLAEAGVIESEKDGVDDKDFIELSITNEAGVEDTARLWFVGGAANISFNTLRDIVVHSAKTEADKAKARDAVDAVTSTDDLVAILNDHCIGSELWFTKYYDPNRTYQAQDGSVRKSVNKNVYGYEPRLKPELMPQEQKAADPQVDALNKTFPGNEPDAGATIPDNWS